MNGLSKNLPRDQEQSLGYSLRIKNSAKSLHITNEDDREIAQK